MKWWTLPVLAGLLHDIGKFGQRAGAPATQGMDQEYCKDGTSHRHVLYTDYFIEHTLPLPPELQAVRSKLARMAAAHHRPDNASAEEMALHKADCLSSGGDRMDGLAEGDYKTARLESVFTHVRLNGKGLADTGKPLRYCLRSLDDKNAAPTIFPVKLEEAQKGSSYKELYTNFLAALKKIPLDLGVRHYVTSLTSVLECYTWCIPSSTYKTRADISLYDHATTTAAIAQALLACPGKGKKLLLFGGEISGIQKFIFGTEGGMADKGASKLLRARSLYLQALTRSVWLTLLDKLELAPVAKIMDAGGRFVLLLPDTAQVRETLDQLCKDIETWLLSTFMGTVRMTFAHLPLHPDDLHRERFCACFEQFNDALEDAKLHPFARAFGSGVSPVMNVDYAAYAEHGECECCHTRPASDTPDDKLDDTLDETHVCTRCRQLIRCVGSRLPKAHYLVFTRVAQGVQLFGDLHLRLEDSHIGKDMLKQSLDVVNICDYKDFSAVPVAHYVPQVTQDDLDKWQTEGRSCAKDDLEEEPVNVGMPKTFALLAEEARVQSTTRKGWRSIACLAACKADVDNLGLLFGLGFGTGKESMFSISRFAMLSRMMNHFFAAHVPQLIKREFPNMYLIFAGGDDLFALGPWSEAVHFARRLRTDFGQFTGNNPAVTFSAGLPVFKPGLPMRALRQAAEDALEKSKHLPGKDAATLFGISAAWTEFDNLLQRGEWLEDLCLKEIVTQGFVRRLLGYARDCAAFTANGEHHKLYDLRKGLYLSHMAYDIKRNCDVEKISPQDLGRLWGMGQDKQTFPQEELGITWALYRTRTTC